MLRVLIFMQVFAIAPKDVAEAKRLIHESIREYNVADFDRALADAVAAYNLDPLPAILFNLGQCHRALRHWDKAAFFFKRYLAQAPNATNWRLATQLLAEAEAKASVSAAGGEPSAAAGPRASPPAPGPAARVATPAVSPSVIVLAPYGSAAPPVASPPPPVAAVSPPPPVAAVAPPPPAAPPPGSTSWESGRKSVHEEPVAPAAVAADVHPAPAEHSHALAYTLVAGGIAGLAVATVGAAELLNFSALQGQLRTGGYSGSYPQATGALSSAQLGQKLLIGGVALALIGLVGAGFTW